jgi:hypothetical protein
LILIESGGYIFIIEFMIIFDVGSATFEKISFNSFLSSSNGCVISGIIDNGKEILIKGCTFTSIYSEGNGGVIYVELKLGGNFEIGSSGDSTPSSFSSCSAGSGKGGGIYIKIGSVTTGFSFSGGLSFTNCDAARGKNIYIESGDLKNAITSTSFKYNYDSSLFKNTNELYGGELSFEVDLRNFLCPLQSYSENGYFFYLFIILEI